MRSPLQVLFALLVTLALLSCHGPEAVERRTAGEGGTIVYHDSFTVVTRVHDDQTGVTCWVNERGISCLRDQSVICAQRDEVIDGLGTKRLPKELRERVAKAE